MILNLKHPIKLIRKILNLPYKAAKSILYKTLDLIDKLKGNKERFIPPRSMIFIGDGDYKKTGNEFFSYFLELGELKRDAKILDVGCGIGRMSLPLTKYLSREGEYYGFDIVKKGIGWCNKNISPAFPNFHYDHSDIYNKMYNPEGIEKSSEYRFKYNDQTFDFVFLTSVFTHMFSVDIEHYICEISRVMKRGGRCFITFFLLNEESKNLIKSGISTQNLIFEIDEYSFTKDKNVPESAIGFKENYIKTLFYNKSLKIKEPIYYGSWCGRKEFKSYQDIIVAEKL